MMNDEPEKPEEQSPDESGSEFGLTAPREDFKSTPEPDAMSEAGSPVDRSGNRPRSLDVGAGGGAWKGFEEEQEEEDQEFDFGAGKELPEDELDMTPMVDVTFLLLIFFMVTASFTLRKSFEQAHSKVEDPSTNVVDPKEDEDDFVEVIIDQTNTYYIRTRDTDEIEAPTDLEMRDTLRAAREIAGTGRLIIRAHVDALHSKVVKVLDTGNSVGMERIETVVTEVEY